MDAVGTAVAIIAAAVVVHVVITATVASENPSITTGTRSTEQMGLTLMKVDPI